MSTAFLDLAGIALIGLTTALAVSVTADTAPPESLTPILGEASQLGLPLEQLALWCALAAGLVLIGKTLISFDLSRRIMRFLATRTAMVSARLTAQLLSRPLLEVQRRTSQQTAYTLTTGVNSAVLLILAQATIVVSEMALLLVLCVGLVLLSPVIAVCAMAFFLSVFLVIHRLLSGWAQSLGGKLAQADIESIGAIQDAIRTYRESLVGHRRDLQVAHIQDLRWNSARASAAIQMIGVTPKYTLEIALVLGTGALAVSQLLTKTPVEAVSMIVLFLAAGARIVPSLLRLQTAILGIRQANGAAASVFDLEHEVQPELSPRSAAYTWTGPGRRNALAGSWTSHSGFTGDVSLMGVSFRYPGSTSFAIEDITLRVESGTSLALVGTTGSGKSTLADLVLGVLLPDTGQVSVSGQEPTVAASMWPGVMAYVPQDVGLVSGTVFDNVALGIPSSAVTAEMVWEALDRACLAEFLIGYREGLETTIGEHGVKLSGGQRQRLGIARALLTHPKLIVLDEATSALDAETEERVGRTIRSLSGEVTVIVVAHRLATIRNCDQVCYLEQGRVAALGHFDQVRVDSPAFDRQAGLLGL